MPNEEQQQQLALLQHKESELRKMQSRLESYQEEVLQLRDENFQLKAVRAFSSVDTSVEYKVGCKVMGLTVFAICYSG